MKCQNCGNTNIENFCFHCGQKRITERLSLTEFKKDIVNTFFNYESVLFKTIFKLFIQPQKVITDYFYGKRKSYFNPVKLLFIVLTIVTILEVQLNESIDETRLALEILQSEYWKLIMIVVLVPIFSVLSYIFFKKYKYNFTEHLVINAYFLSIHSIFLILVYSLKFFHVIDFNTGKTGMIVGTLVIGCMPIFIEIKFCGRSSKRY